MVNKKTAKGIIKERIMFVINYLIEYVTDTMDLSPEELKEFTDEKIARILREDEDFDSNSEANALAHITDLASMLQVEIDADILDRAKIYRSRLY